MLLFMVGNARYSTSTVMVINIRIKKRSVGCIRPTFLSNFFRKLEAVSKLLLFASKLGAIPYKEMLVDMESMGH